jgi:hypothetical protein
MSKSRRKNRTACLRTEKSLTDEVGQVPAVSPCCDEHARAGEEKCEQETEPRRRTQEYLAQEWTTKQWRLPATRAPNGTEIKTQQQWINEWQHQRNVSTKGWNLTSQWKGLKSNREKPRAHLLLDWNSSCCTAPVGNMKILAARRTGNGPEECCSRKIRCERYELKTTAEPNPAAMDWVGKSKHQAPEQKALKNENRFANDSAPDSGKWEENTSTSSDLRTVHKNSSSKNQKADFFHWSFN